MGDRSIGATSEQRGERACLGADRFAHRGALSRDANRASGRMALPNCLAILGTEFLWARRLLRYGKDRAVRLFCRARGVPAS